MTEQAQEASSRHSWRLNDWLGVVVFSAAALCAAIWLLELGRGLTFFFDEWDFIEEAGTSGYWHNVLQPHNGHPSMIPFSMYEVLLHTVGLRHYWPYQLVLVLLDIGCGWLLFLLLRRKVHPLVAGAASAALMLLGPAWQDLLWPFQFGFLGSVAGGLGALVLLDRATRRGDIGACICLVASVACSGVGLPFVAGVIVELAWRRRSWRRMWIPAIPLGLFVVWYEAIGKSATSSSISASSVVHSIGTDTATTVGALVGRRIDRRIRTHRGARRRGYRCSSAKSRPGGATRHGNKRAHGVLAADITGTRRSPRTAQAATYTPQRPSS